VTLMELLVLAGTPGALPDDAIELTPMKNALVRADAKSKPARTVLTLSVDTRMMTPASILNGTADAIGFVVVVKRSALPA
jgi:hypothetical protein